MDSKQMIAFLVAVFLIVVGISSLIFSRVFIDIPETEIIEIPVDAFTHSNVIGMNVDNDMLHFGTVPYEGVGKKYFNVTNENDKILYATLNSSGNVSPYLKYPESIVIEPGRTDTVIVEFYSPASPAAQAFEGSLYVNIIYK